VGYIASVAVVASLRALGGKIACIRGNHEAMLLEGQVPAHLESVYQLGETKQRLAEDDLQFLKSWPPLLRRTFPSGAALFVHGSPRDPTQGYVYEDSSLADLNADADFVFMGHTHRSFVRREGGRTFANVGSCGLPRDDGRFGAAGLFNEATGAIQLVRFDITQATSAALAGAPPVHASVELLFRRRAHP
jgi:predicted phosphodiesterase